MIPTPVDSFSSNLWATKITLDLMNLDQWVLWQLEQTDQKPGKVVVKKVPYTNHLRMPVPQTLKRGQASTSAFRLSLWP